MDGFIALVDLATEIGRHDQSIRYWVKHGKLPRPVKILGRLCFTTEQATQVKDFFDKRDPWQRG